MVNDIRSLTKEEMTKDWVLRGVMVGLAYRARMPGDGRFCRATCEFFLHISYTSVRILSNSLRVITLRSGQICSRQMSTCFKVRSHSDVVMFTHWRI